MHQYQNYPTPLWSPYLLYQPGMVAWCNGTSWRCEAIHSGADPASNLHLWTPISSHHRSYFPGSSSGPSYSSPPAYSSYPSGPEIISPVPLHMPARPPSPGSDESTETLTEKSITSSFSRMNPFFERAAEGVRYITQKDESRKAVQRDELKKEVQGKKIWKVSGLGVWAYDLDPKVEREKASIWKDYGKSRSDWLKHARARTEFYLTTRGIKPLLMWKLVEGGQIPEDALPIGSEDDGKVLFAARSWWEGGVHLGKAGAHLMQSASISYGGSELNLDVYEVLCGPSDPDLIKWMTFRHGERASVQGWQPVEGGREANGAALLLAKGEYESGEHPGKCLIDDDHACVGYGGGELWVRPFQILAYSSSHPR